LSIDYCLLMSKTKIINKKLTITNAKAKSLFISLLAFFI
jgi:hypothetical protein